MKGICLQFPAVFLLFCLTFSGACQKPATTQNGSPDAAKTPPEKPAWLLRIITDFEKETPTNPPVKIYSYQYQDQQVYYVSGYCCDIPSQAYTADGKQLCQPDGGITGRGDGKCPDFFQTRSNEKLIWEDPRK